MISGPKPIQIAAGTVFGRLTVIGPAPKIGRRHAWHCQCACGQQTRVRTDDLTLGATQSCGCIRRLPNLTGKLFGRWSVLRADGPKRYLCRCSCGAERSVLATMLNAGRSQSCGCLGNERAAAYQRKHGYRDHLEYHTWLGIRHRCTDPKNPGYRLYGGRGIKVYEPWLESPAVFICDVEALLGPRPAGMSIDRIDVNGNYEPGNIRWATAKEQVANRRPPSEWKPRRRSAA